MMENWEEGEDEERERAAIRERGESERRALLSLLAFACCRLLPCGCFFLRVAPRETLTARPRWCARSAGWPSAWKPALWCCGGGEGGRTERVKREEKKRKSENFQLLSLFLDLHLDLIFFLVLSLSLDRLHNFPRP